MRYVSTRGGMPPASFGEILLGGLAPDGGLVVPETYPQIDAKALASWRELDYPALAIEIISRYVDDIDRETLETLIRRSYTPDAFGSSDIVPVTRLEPGLHLVRLSNGPTLAFKDIAMQLLGNLFEQALASSGAELNILGATSGDTGSAAEYAMRGKRGIRVFMLSPAGRMSAFQRAQMFSLLEPNIFNIAVNGVFDECQDMVKSVSADLEFKRRHSIGTVNSINWARVVAQVVYYFHAWARVAAGPLDPVSFCVPSGNFGNVLAGHIARSMGLPIRKLVVATNENDVLDEFFRTGRYRPRDARETHATSSPSMDISKASNFERFVFDLVGRDPQRVRALWNDIDREGEFDIGGSDAFGAVERFGFVSGRSTHADRVATIRDARRRFGVLVDTHTADGLFVAEHHREPDVPMLCLETAQPAKFAETIREAIGESPGVPPGYAGIEQKVQHFVQMPADVELLKQYVASHCDARPAGR
ncbi:MAG: threonine synthase [Burkholderiaceae bacterium]